MGARLFAILFLSLVAFGVWFQRAYMATYSAEFDALKAGDKTPMELISVRPFAATQYRNGTPMSRVRSDEAVYFTNGRIVLTGNVTYQDFDETGGPRLAVASRRALAQLQLSSGGVSLFDSEKRLERVEFPGDVTLTLGAADRVITRRVDVDFTRALATTDESVRLEGPGRSMQGRGFLYHMDTQDFRLGGRVSGEFVLPPRATRSTQRSVRATHPERTENEGTSE